MAKNALLVLGFLMALGGFFPQLHAAESNQTEEETITAPLYKPLIERYILDELKQLRQDHQTLRVEVAEKVTAAKLESSDRAIRYTADTTNNIFYIITAAASILVLIGWKSLNDIRDNVRSTTEKRVEELTAVYEDRLNALEAALKERSDQIVAAQQDISDNTLIHSLWMRAGLEKNEQEKLKIYDQILEIKPDDVEALTYKADTLLDINEDSWALSLVEKALEIDSEYAMAYWQKACAEAKLDLFGEALADIHKALELSAAMKEKLSSESNFEKLKHHREFMDLIDGSVASA